MEKRTNEQPYSIGVRCHDCGAPVVSHGRLFHSREAIPTVLKKLVIPVFINGGWYVNDWVQPCIRCGCSQILKEEEVVNGVR